MASARTCTPGIEEAEQVEPQQPPFSFLISTPSPLNGGGACSLTFCEKSSMQQCDKPSRITSGLVAGIASVLTLLAMSLNIGGLDNITSIIRDFGVLFSIAAMLAFGCGLFLYKLRLRWSAVAGAATGLLCGFLIVIFVTSRI
jgi:hypothetical protein